jgi:hypothetical protein
MENSTITYSKYQIIEAETEEDAVKEYNSKNNCSYYYGKCLGEYNESTGRVEVSVSIFIKESH